MIDWSRAPRDLITTLIAADNGFLQSEGGTYYTVIIAAPKKRERRRRALLRYFLEPKFRYGLTVRFRMLRAWLSGVAREMPLSRVRGNRSEGPRP